MNLIFDIDFDSEELSLIVDDTYSVKAYIGEDGKIRYKNFDRIDNDTVQDKLKDICKELLQLLEE